MSKMELKDFASRPPLTHLKRLTTPRGLVQHADLEVPDPAFGYSLDDNARALIVCLWHYQLFADRAILNLFEIYWRYLQRARNQSGSFHNFLSFSESILDAEGTEDSIGRAIWALGTILGSHPDLAVGGQAERIITETNLSKHTEHPHVRAKALILCGLMAAKDRSVATWADQLITAYEHSKSANWPWFEDNLRYANGILPYALATSYLLTKNRRYLDVARVSFDWLNTVSRIGGQPAPIGQNGWYYQGGEKALYDQQPLEAADMVLAASALFEATDSRPYLDLALEWMSWYGGHNSQGTAVFNAATGGVYDALTPTGVNKNQGAESIVTYLMAYLALTKLALRQ